MQRTDKVQYQQTQQPSKCLPPISPIRKPTINIVTNHNTLKRTIKKGCQRQIKSNQRGIHSHKNTKSHIQEHKLQTSNREKKNKERNNQVNIDHSDVIYLRHPNFTAGKKKELSSHIETHLYTPNTKESYGSLGRLLRIWSE